MVAHVRTVHPFPARMAPDIAFEAISTLAPHSVVLDPMCGSGTVVRWASDAGHTAFGLDIDPLAVLMARVWTQPLDPVVLRRLGNDIIRQSNDHSAFAICLPWIDDDIETRQFIEFWFACPQRDQLRRLVCHILPLNSAYGDALKLALSRIIITKESGASLARDTSHSRPHRVKSVNDYDVFVGFQKSVDRLANELERFPAKGNVSIQLGDARKLPNLPTGQVDAVITSPPYLNAIDYLRGHRLSLVWFGYSIGSLRAIRSVSIGTEKKGSTEQQMDIINSVVTQVDKSMALQPNINAIVSRFCYDMAEVLSETYGILRDGGWAVFVIGNSNLKGAYIDNSKIITMLALDRGFRLTSSYTRPIPERRRYLPLPTAATDGALAKRMRLETVLTFMK